MATAGDGNEMWDGREELHPEQEETAADEVSEKAKCSGCFPTEDEFEENLQKTQQVK